MSVHDDDEEAICARVEEHLDLQRARSGGVTSDAIAEAVAAEIVRLALRTNGTIIAGPTAKSLGYGLTHEELRDWAAKSG